MIEIIEEIREELQRLSDEKVKESSERFFKEKIKCYGVKSAQIQILTKKISEKISPLNKNEVFEICENLWKSQMLEEGLLAANISWKNGKKYKPEDFSIFSRWIDEYITNWACCDTFCNHTIGDFIQKYPVFIEKLIEFTKSENRWTRRAAAVSLIVPAKKGLFENDVQTIALRLLLDKDDMVQKGYGWLLKVTSQANLPFVYNFNFVMEHKPVMPRTALRYAIEKFPENMRKEAMQK